MVENFIDHQWEYVICNKIKFKKNHNNIMINIAGILYRYMDVILLTVTVVLILLLGTSIFSLRELTPVSMSFYEMRKLCSVQKSPSTDANSC